MGTVRIQYFPSHRRTPRKIPTSGYGGLNVEPLDTEIDAYAHKRFQAQKIYKLEVDDERLIVEFVDETKKRLPLKDYNTRELSSSRSMLDNSTSKNKLLRVIIA